MKIIGKTNGGWILTASRTEVANLVGYYSAYDDGATKLKSGDEINVADMYRQLYYLANHQEELSKLSQYLIEVANQLVLREPIIRNATNELNEESVK